MFKMKFGWGKHNSVSLNQESDPKTSFEKGYRYGVVYDSSHKFQMTMR